jgi:tyrosyl-tRNA synthetase
MNIDEKRQLIDNFFSRGVAEVIPSKEDLKKRLLSDKKITIYIGADPTAPKLHLGHSTNILLLRILQKLGHKIIILIGDFTGMIGDPTDKSATRVPLTREQVLENAKTYRQQLEKLIDFEGENPAEIKFNSAWLSKLNAEDIIRLMANFTVQQMIERDMFQKRLSENKPIGLHEFIYPLMQGYDSVAMKVDAEMGGTDQTFNMMMGRHLEKSILGKDKFVISTELLVNPKTGKKLMSKSEGGYVGLNDEPNEMYGKIMALADETVEPCFRMCTTLDLNKIDFGSHPMELKKQLAWEITKMYHSENDANRAGKYFEDTVQKKSVGDGIKEVRINKNVITIGELVSLLVEHGLVASKSEGRRLIEQGGVYIENLKVSLADVQIKIGNEKVLRAGKRKYLKLVS